MLEKIIKFYVFLFARKRFEKFNRLIFRLSLGGLGVLNHKTSAISGERAFLKKYLPGENGVLIDVGANEGDYSIEALKYHPGLKVYALEPHPISFKRLVQKTKSNQSIFPINKGLSSRRGLVRLFDYKDKDGSAHASLFETVITEIHGADDSVAHDVEITTLDALVESNNIDQIVLLKIDTEGSELDVLKGGANSLSKKIVKAIHFEFNEMNIVSRVFFKDFWSLLEGYRFYRLLPNELIEIKHYNALACEIFAYQNIIAILNDQ